MVYRYPEPRARFRQFGASSLDFELLLTAINNRFNAEGVEIPFEKRDVYIKEMPVKP